MDTGGRPKSFMAMLMDSDDEAGGESDVEMDDADEGTAEAPPDAAVQ